MSILHGLAMAAVAATSGWGHTFARAYGTVAEETGIGIVALADGGFLAAAATEPEPGWSGTFVVRIDGRGEELWRRTIIDSGAVAVPSGIAGDGNGGCLIVGKWKSERPDWDMSAVRLDSAGNRSWSVTWGSEQTGEVATSVCRTQEGWAVCGSTMENGQDDIRLDRLTESGAIYGTVITGTDQPDYAYAVAQTADLGLVVAGSTLRPGSRYSDAYIIRTDLFGQVLWAHNFGDSLWDEARAVVETPERNIVAAGFTSSYGTGMDAYLLATDSTGSGLWQRTYGFDGSDRAFGLCVAQDRGFLLTGESFSPGNEHADVCLFKTDTEGRLEWQRLYGGVGDDRGAAAVSLDDSGFGIAGTTWTDSTSRSDLYVLRTSPLGTIGLAANAGDPPGKTLASPNPFRTCVSFTGGVAWAKGAARVYSAEGRMVRELRGESASRWDGRDADGQQVRPGIYYGVLPSGVVKLVKSR
jgi:hypothetical protein